MHKILHKTGNITFGTVLPTLPAAGNNIKEGVANFTEFCT
jgi:hypothetical protein